MEVVVVFVVIILVVIITVTVAVIVVVIVIMTATVIVVVVVVVVVVEIPINTYSVMYISCFIDPGAPCIDTGGCISAEVTPLLDGLLRCTRHGLPGGVH